MTSRKALSPKTAPTQKLASKEWSHPPLIMTHETNDSETTISEKRASFFRRRWKLILVLLGWLLFLGWAGLTGLLWWIERDLPNLRTLANYRPWRITRVLDSQGDVAMELAEQRRTVVRYKEMPRHLIQAVVSAEDADFFKHKGLSYTGMLRAFWKNLWRPKGAPMQGGSTITQQVVKTFLLTPKQTYRRKLREAILAHRLEQNLTKQEILFLYLNQIDFGQGCYGVAEAARVYFGKSVSQLTLAESVILAGIPKHPPRYNPIASVVHTTRRRNYVLRMMLHHGYIKQAQYRRERSRPVTRPRPSPQPPFQRDDFTRYVARRSLRILQRVMRQRYPNNPQRIRSEARHLLYRGGLNIETTLNTQAQKLARDTLQKGLASLEVGLGWSGPPFQAGLVVLQPQTRRVMAMLEGRFFAAAGLARATQIKKPMGTLFQPFVYTAAIASRRFTSASTIHTAPFYLLEGNKQWRIETLSPPKKLIRLRKALASQITPVVGRIVSRLGREPVIKLSTSLGILAPFASRRQLILGEVATTPMQVTNAFATLAAHGAYDKPTWITRILTHDGKTLYERLPNPQRRMSSGVSYIMLHMLKDAMKQGPARVTQIHKSSIAGYAGTTLNRRHTWYVGCLPYLCLGLWIGMDNQKAVPKKAGNPALSLGLSWLKRYLKTSAGRRHRNKSFSVSEEVVLTTIDPVTGLLARPNQSKTIQEVFLYRTQPSTYAPLSQKASSKP